MVISNVSSSSPWHMEHGIPINRPVCPLDLPVTATAAQPSLPPARKGVRLLARRIRAGQVGPRQVSVINGYQKPTHVMGYNIPSLGHITKSLALTHRNPPNKTRINMLHSRAGRKTNERYQSVGAQKHRPKPPSITQWPTTYISRNTGEYVLLRHWS